MKYFQLFCILLFSSWSFSAIGLVLLWLNKIVCSSKVWLFNIPIVFLLLFIEVGYNMYGLYSILYYWIDWQRELNSSSVFFLFGICFVRFLFVLISYWFYSLTCWHWPLRGFCLLWYYFLSICISLFPFNHHENGRVNFAVLSSAFCIALCTLFILWVEKFDKYDCGLN